MTRRKYTHIGIIAAFCTTQTGSYYECLSPLGALPSGSHTGEKFLEDENFIARTGITWRWLDDDKSQFEITIGYPKVYHTPNSVIGGPNPEDGSELFSMSAWGYYGSGAVSQSNWNWDRLFPGSNRPYVQYSTHAILDNPEIGPDERQYDTTYVEVQFDWGLRFPTNAEFLQSTGGRFTGELDNSKYPDVKFSTKNVITDSGFRFVKWHIVPEGQISKENEDIIAAVNVKDINGISFTTHESKYHDRRDNYTKLYIWAEFTDKAKYVRDNHIKCDAVGRIIFDPKTNMPIWY